MFALALPQGLWQTGGTAGWVVMGCWPPARAHWCCAMPCHASPTWQCQQVTGALWLVAQGSPRQTHPQPRFGGSPAPQAAVPGSGRAGL